MNNKFLHKTIIELFTCGCVVITNSIIFCCILID